MAIRLNASTAIKADFCPNHGYFREKVIDILTKHLFKPNLRSSIAEIYDSMTSDINTPQNILYPLYGDPLNVGIKKTNFTFPPYHNANPFYPWAGHDLPVWIGNPEHAQKKLMIVSQDPRRNVEEMVLTLGKSDGISISTPFGLHSYEWRSNETNGLIHYVVCELFKQCENNLSVYYTDVYKLRWVNNTGFPKMPSFDKDNKSCYQEILKEEVLVLFKPDVILFLGQAASKAFFGSIKVTKISSSTLPPSITGISSPTATVTKAIINGQRVTIVEVPHPSGSAGKSWGKGVSMKKRREIITGWLMSVLKP